MLLNGKTDVESKEIVDDFVGRYTGALAEEKSFFDAIPSQLDFSKFKTEEIGIDEFAEVAQDIERVNPITNMKNAMRALKSAVQSRKIEHEKEDKSLE